MPSNASAEPGENGHPPAGQRARGPPRHPHPELPAGPWDTAVLRLAGGSHPCEGAVQVQHRGRWMPVCRDSWSAAASRELCRRLRCGDAEGDAVAVSPDGDGDAAEGCPTAPANCSGWEPRLCQLQMATEPGCCAAGQASVTCTGKGAAGAAGAGRPRGTVPCASASPSHPGAPVLRLAGGRSRSPS